jgi:hypothetical protein
VNAYVTPDGDLIYVEVLDLLETETPYHCREYRTTHETTEGRKFIVFTLPERWTHTFQKFKEGKYSEFTKLAKATIIQYSGLSWRMKTAQLGKEISDARLLAMYRRESLKVLLAEQLAIDPQMLDDQELLAPPKPSEFMVL